MYHNQYNSPYGPICTASGDGWSCDRDHLAKGLCDGHYAQRKRGRVLTPLRSMRKPRPKQKVERHDPNDMLCRVPKGHQRCTACCEVKRLSEFFEKKKRGQYTSTCRRCQNRRRVDDHYGDGAADWKDQRLAANGGRCGMCGGTESGDRSWHLDHDHAYDRKDKRGWRDVLCASCNLAEGRVRKGWDVVAFVAGMRKRGLLTE